MKTFSLYRGQARTGIGEGPDRPPVHHGEQFLAADPPLDQDGEILSAARPWMTLDWRPADEQALGEKIEAWSFFPHGGLCFVVRLAAAGIYDRRAAYFAHARAFPAAEFDGPCDPGALLGNSKAFDEPWNDRPRPEPGALAEPAPVRPDQVLAEPAVAGALLAHLYQGLLDRRPVVMAAPVRDFEKGSPLHALVSFARAALPLELKTGCRIRVFTRLPDLFLRHLGTDLLVLPENEAANALAAQRDATLLDRTGARRAGRDFSPEAGQYAEAVLKRFDRLPEGLLPFSRAIGKHFPTHRLPGEQELARVSALYIFLAARKDPALLGNWIRSGLLQQVSEQPTGLPWDRLLRPEDWQSLRSDDLDAIVLTDVAGDEAQGIVELARRHRTNPLSADSIKKHWDGLSRPERPAFLRKLLRERLASSEQVAEWSASLPLAEILASGPAAPLLEAELQADRISRREAEAEPLAAAARQPEAAQVLACAASAGKLSRSFALRLLQAEEIRDGLETKMLLKLAGSASSLGPWLDRRVEKDPRETITALLQADCWAAWRKDSSLFPESQRQAALAWLASDAWQDRPSPPRRLENWKQIVRDLGHLSGEEIADLRNGASKGFRWPWITPFEDVQLDDLLHLVGFDLGALAELAESIDPWRDLGYPLDGTIFEHVLALADPALREGLPPNALSLLSDRPDATLSLSEAEILLERTKHRKEIALSRLRRSIEVSSKHDSQAARQAAERWFPGQTELLKAIRSAGPARSRLGPALEALLEGDATAHCWKKMAADVTRHIARGSKVPHPVSLLVASLRQAQLDLEERRELEKNGWKTFSTAANLHPILLRQPYPEKQPLPALELAALLSPREGIGRLALCLVRLPGTREHTAHEAWWESLFTGLERNCWGNGLRSTGDREETTLALIFQELPGLLLTDRLVPIVQSLIKEHMEKLYFRQDLHLARNLVSRATSCAGAV